MSSLLAALPAWQSLKAHHKDLAGLHLRELFARDPGRGERLAAEAAGLYLDYSKHRITDQTLRLLTELAERLDPVRLAEATVADGDLVYAQRLGVIQDKRPPSRPCLKLILLLPGLKDRMIQDKILLRRLTGNTFAPHGWQMKLIQDTMDAPQ